MFVELKHLIKTGDIIAVAVSGGKDSMCLLHYLNARKTELKIDVLALNVEHGIRGQASVNDSDFVNNYCNSLDIPVIRYSVNATEYAQTNKLSIEESARILRYECFFEALNKNKCTKIATAHHLCDNTESILFNLFRGTGVKGACGITENFNDKIIRPFLEVPKPEIEEYIIKNDIPFVTDDTNFNDDYTRNYIRHNVIPSIEKAFPKAQQSLLRFAKILKTDNDFLERLAKQSIKEDNNVYKITLPCEKAVFNRACIIILKKMGVEKDWELVHIEKAFELTEMQNGKKINLPNGIIATKEYNEIVFSKEKDYKPQCIPFCIGKSIFNGRVLEINNVFSSEINLKDGLYVDSDKIPKTAVIRFYKEGDVFKKFGGGTKKLGDFFTNQKIPERLRKTLPLIADGNKVLAVFSIAISDCVKVDKNTNNIIQLNYKL